MTGPIVVIGAGPAGLSCVYRLAQAGRAVYLFDDNAQPGGQYFRQLPPSYLVRPSSKLKRDRDQFDTLSSALDAPNVRYFPSTVVFGVTDSKTIAYSGPSGSGRVRASAIVIATGAQERSMPFDGWTLPGVISAGGCLNLVKGHGLVPNGRTVVAGNGPLVLVAAATLVAAGASVVSVIEAQRDLRLLPLFYAGLTRAPAIVAKALEYRWTLLKAGVSFQTGRMVSSCHGADRLESVLIAPIGADGRPRNERAKRIEADTLVLGYGLLPGSESAKLLGCEIVNATELGGLVPRRNVKLQTDVDGIYAIGDGAGIGGVMVALVEGEIAATAILGAQVSHSRLKQYRRLDDYRRRVTKAYRVVPKLSAAVADTIVCRCEELTLRSLRAHLEHSDGLNVLKTFSRLGMGRCQGRYCTHVAAEMLGFEAENPRIYPRTRPPLRPITVADFAEDGDAGPARIPDESLAQANTGT